MVTYRRTLHPTTAFKIKHYGLLAYSKIGSRMPLELPALRVNQWLKEWDEVDFDAFAGRKRPDPYFFLFSISAPDLKALTGIQRRTTDIGMPRSNDPRIQRRHEHRRSREIREYVRYGYPWSELSEGKRSSGEFGDLRKPGWLPTSIVVNIITPDLADDSNLDKDDTVTIQENPDGRTAVVRLPESFTDASWRPSARHPIEVIDGQHRLWAFEEMESLPTYELPVVAFVGLDVSWQAYLFWTINIRPKRINPSLAFDLYPLLRTAEWLDKFHGHSVYREARAQELTEALWGHPESPWYHRINMLGEPGLRRRMVSQAALIRSLMATYVKSWESPGARIGGLFGTTRENHVVLSWSRAQQAAFLIMMGIKLRESIASSELSWAQSLRVSQEQLDLLEEDLLVDPAFGGPHSLLSTDQGMRGLFYVTNDLCFLMADDLKLEDWTAEELDVNAAASD